jgi:hypothetical protein
MQADDAPEGFQQQVLRELKQISQFCPLLSKPLLQ